MRFLKYRRQTKKKKKKGKGYSEDATNLILLMLATLVSGTKNYSKMKKNTGRN